jgi:DNA-binding CsgD family transcriptional regulator
LLSGIVPDVELSVFFFPLLALSEMYWAQGLTDAQIAEALVISPRTVNAHLRSIYSKLDITSRNAATYFALEHHLI